MILSPMLMVNCLYLFKRYFTINIIISVLSSLSFSQWATIHWRSSLTHAVSPSTACSLSPGMQRSKTVYNWISSAYLWYSIPCLRIVPCIGPDYTKWIWLDQVPIPEVPQNARGCGLTFQSQPVFAVYVLPDRSGTMRELSQPLHTQSPVDGAPFTQLTEVYPGIQVWKKSLASYQQIYSCYSGGIQRCF